jgi:hypothetical protein
MGVMFPEVTGYTVGSASVLAVVHYPNDEPQSYQSIIQIAKKRAEMDQYKQYVNPIVLIYYVKLSSNWCTEFV